MPKTELEELIKQLNNSPDKVDKFDLKATGKEYAIYLYGSELNGSIGNIYVYVEGIGTKWTFRFATPRLNLYAKTSLQNGGNSLVKSFIKLVESLPPKLVEIDMSHQNDSKVLAQSYWNNWQSDFGKTYEEHIHPEVKKSLVAMLTISKRLPKKGFVVDLMGGDGSLLNDIIETPRFSNYSAALIDNNQKALGRARKKFSNKSNVKVYPAIDLTKRFPAFDKKPNIVLIVGGLTFGIVKKAQAREIMSRVYAAIAKNGYCIVTGMSPSLLNSADFKAFGFKVEQCSIPKHVIRQEPPYQLYILHKN